MAEVLVEFDTSLRDTEGTRWGPRVCGRVANDGLWEGWIEFTPDVDSIDPIRTARETQQSSRDALMYWAQGLTKVYLESALERALEPPRARRGRPSAPPHFEAPAPRYSPASGSSDRVARPVLNPFEVYRQGEDILVEELAMLDLGRIRDIVVAFGLLDVAIARGRSRPELIAAIIAGVRYPSGDHGSTNGDTAI